MGQGVVRLGCVLKLDPERDPLQQFDVGVLVITFKHPAKADDV